MPTYISAEGLEKLKEELDDRKKIQRKVIAERIAAAKELGDLSENFEYHEAKEQQGLNEMRIVELEQMTKEAVLVEQQKGGETVELGCTFTAELNGEEKTFEIVGSSESDPTKGKISNESPIGKAFLGCKEGDKIEIDVPSGKMTYVVKEIF